MRGLLATAGHHLPRLAIAAIFVLPLVWVISASLREVGLPPPRRLEWWPQPVAWSNYARVFELVPLQRQILNSVLVLAMAVPLTILVASWAGLAMAEAPRRWRRALVMLTVMLLMVPGTAVWLARFLVFKHLGMIDTLWALAAPAVMGTSPLFVLLYYWTFSRILASLFETARLDGASPLQVWALVAMPMAWRTTFAVAVLASVLYWSDVVSPILFLKSEHLTTLPVGLQALHQLDATSWPLLMAGVVIMTAPIVLLFALIQRYLSPEHHHS